MRKGSFVAFTKGKKSPKILYRSLEAQLQAGLARALGWFHGRQVEDDGPLRALPCS